MRTDKERLDWLEKQPGVALINDDFGNWAVSGDGEQNIPENPGECSDIYTSFFIEKNKWHKSIRGAIDSWMDDSEI